jgi:hypothetical protein
MSEGIMKVEAKAAGGDGASGGERAVLAADRGASRRRERSKRAPDEPEPLAALNVVGVDDAAEGGGQEERAGGGDAKRQGGQRGECGHRGRERE